MKLESFKFQDGKVFWLPEYPEEPGYPCLDCTKMDCDAAKCTEKYEDAITQSLASAIEVALEDTNDFKILWERTYKGVPMSGEVYSAECEMEIVHQYRNNNTKTGHGWWECSEQYYSSKQRPYEFRQVAHLKPKDEISLATSSHSRKENSAHGYTEGSDSNLPKKRESEGQEKLLDSLLEEILPAIFNFAKNSDNESYDKALRKALTKFSITRRK